MNSLILLDPELIIGLLYLTVAFSLTLLLVITIVTSSLQE